MATPIEEKYDILIQMAEDTDEPIDSALLQDLDTVKGFYDTLKDRSMLQARFFYRLSDQDLIRLCRLDIIPEEDLVDVFYKTKFPQNKMVSILRKMDFDGRKKVMDQLKSMDYPKFDDLEKKIDARYGMMGGVIFQTMDEDEKNPSLMETVKKMLSSKSTSVDALKQYLYVASKTQEDYQHLVQSMVKKEEDVIKNTNRIESKEEFSQIVKLAYLLCMDPKIRDRNTETISKIEARLLSSLLHYQDGKAVAMILEQLPEFLLAKLLDQLAQTAISADIKVKKQAISIKTQLEKLTTEGKTFKIKKTIRRFKLGYTLKK